MATRHRTKAGSAEQVLIPAVGYLRCSDDSQTDDSIPAQKTEVGKWAAANGYRILRWYIDEGISGWKEDREDFQRLMSDLDQRRDFRAVLCWHTNRFSRFPVLEANHYWYLLDRAGVHLASVVQGRQDWNDIGSWLKASITQHGDDQHRFKLSADVKRGKRQVAERGDWAGRPPLGYVVGENRRLQLGDPREVELIRRLFREYLEGRSLRSIAHRLNAEGLAVLNEGRPWQAVCIRAKLVNVAYIGTFQWCDVEMPSHHPAIIDAETFATVQRLLGERKRMTTPTTDGGDWLLTGMVRCGKCGAPMSGSDPAQHYYRCRGAMDRGPTVCDGSIVKQSEIVGYIVDAIEEHWLNPKVIKLLREELHRLVDGEAPKVDPARLQVQLATIDAKLVKAKRRLVEVDVDMLPIVQENIRELRSQHDQVEAALKAASTPPEALYADADQRIDRAVSAFSTLRQVLQTADPVHSREVLRQAVDHVDVWTDAVPNGRKTRFVLDHGFVHLRSDNLLTLSACGSC